MSAIRPDSEGTLALLERAARGDRAALNELLERHRPDMHGFVAARLEAQLLRRVSASDVVQEAQLEVARRMDDFLRRRPMPFHLWVRRTAYERLLNVRRRHRRSARRSVDREVGLPDGSSLALARPLLAAASPSEQAQAAELADRVSRAVARLGEADREVLLMRQVERLSYEEAACLLDVTAAAARQRYGRALLRLRAVLKEEGLLEGES